MSLSAEKCVNICSFLQQCVCTHTARSTHYANEVVKVYAHFATWSAPLPPTTPAFAFTDGVLATLATPSNTHETRAMLHNEILHSAMPRQNSYRLLVSLMQDDLIAKMPNVQLNCASATKEHVRNLKRMMLGYAPECTFKTNGDCPIHTELITTKLPPWSTSMLTHNEMPYPLMKQSYPNSVNAHVRPLLDTPIHDRVQDIDWEGTSFSEKDFIIIVSLVLELMASKKMRMLTNGTITKFKHLDNAQPFMMRLPGGDIARGCRVGGVLHMAPRDCTAAQCVLGWVMECYAQDSSPAAYTAEILFSHIAVSEGNPLRKFVSA